MSLSSLLGQLLNGLAGASSLFLVAVGLSLIFGVTRVVNFAHGSLYMLGIYVAVTLVERLLGAGLGAAGFWIGVALAALAAGAAGALIEMLVLRRIYRAPELFQLLATFAVALIVRDAVLWAWGPEDLLGPRAPGLQGAVALFGRPFPSYDLVLIALGPLVLGALWFVLHRTRFGLLVRAATQDREMCGALGVNPVWLFTGVFAVGGALAGLGGALQVPREPATLGLDLAVIGDAFVVVVVGGMGSIPGAFVAALLIAEIKAVCIGIGTVTIGDTSFSFSKLTLVVEFIVMAVVLVVRPWGLFGRALEVPRNPAEVGAPLRALAPRERGLGVALVATLALLPFAADAAAYLPVLGIDMLIAVLFATSLHFIMGPGGMASFGHAASFGLGAYGAALGLQALHLPMEVALLAAPLLAAAGAMLFGAFAVRLSGVYFAMLTLAFAQIVWALVFQWDQLTGGSNGLVGIWPAPWLAPKRVYYLATLTLVVAAMFVMRRLQFAPFGYALRAGRDSALRAEAIGIDVTAIRWRAYVVAGFFGGAAGALFAFAKGTISPEAIAVGRSIDALVMVLLGGVQTVAGPWVGAALYTWLQDSVMRATDYWRAALGSLILALVMLFPQGVAGAAAAALARLRGGPARSARVVQ